MPTQSSYILTFDKLTLFSLILNPGEKIAMYIERILTVITPSELLAIIHIFFQLLVLVHLPKCINIDRRVMLLQMRLSLTRGGELA